MTTRFIPPPLTVYALINPFTAKVFYVGITSLPLQRRLARHMFEARRFARTGLGSNKQRLEYILSILRRNKEPLIEELEVAHGYIAQFYAERFWIRQYKRVLKHPIVNQTHTIRKRKYTRHA